MGFYQKMIEIHQEEEEEEKKNRILENQCINGGKRRVEVDEPPQKIKIHVHRASNNFVA